MTTAQTKVLYIISPTVLSPWFTLVVNNDGKLVVESYTSDREMKEWQYIMNSWDYQNPEHNDKVSTPEVIYSHTVRPS